MTTTRPKSRTAPRVHPPVPIREVCLIGNPDRRYIHRTPERANAVPKTRDSVGPSPS